MTEKNIYEILHQGLESILDPKEFGKKKDDVNNRAFNKVISDTLKRKLKWKRDLKNPKELRYHTTAHVQDARGVAVEIPVLFYTREPVSYASYGEIGVQKGYLCLGNEIKGITENSGFDIIKKLAKQIFNIDCVGH